MVLALCMWPVSRCQCLHDEIRESYRFSHSQLESRYGPQGAWMRDLLRCLMSTWGIMRACLSMVGWCAWFHGSWRFACGRLLDANACMMRSEIPTVSRIRSWSPDMGPKGPEWGTSLDVWWAHEGSWGHDYCKHGRMMCMIRWFWRSACGRLLDANACMMRSEILTVSRIRSWSPDMGPKGPEWGTSLDVWWAHEGSWGHDYCKHGRMMCVIPWFLALCMWPVSRCQCLHDEIWEMWFCYPSFRILFQLPCFLDF